MESKQQFLLIQNLPGCQKHNKSVGFICTQNVCQNRLQCFKCVAEHNSIYHKGIKEGADDQFEIEDFNKELTEKFANITRKISEGGQNKFSTDISQMLDVQFEILFSKIAETLNKIKVSIQEQVYLDSQKNFEKELKQIAIENLISLEHQKLTKLNPENLTDLVTFFNQYITKSNAIQQNIERQMVSLTKKVISSIESSEVQTFLYNDLIDISQQDNLIRSVKLCENYEPNPQMDHIYGVRHDTSLDPTYKNYPLYLKSPSDQYSSSKPCFIKYDSFNQMLEDSENYQILQIPVRSIGTYYTVFKNQLFSQINSQNDKKIGCFSLKSLKLINERTIETAMVGNKACQDCNFNDFVFLSNKEEIYVVYQRIGQGVVVERISEDLTVEEEWILDLKDKKSFGAIFLIQRKIYFTENYSSSPTKITVCFDLVKNLIQDLNIPFSNIGAYDGCLYYNNHLRKLMTISFADQKMYFYDLQYEEDDY